MPYFFLPWNEFAHSTEYIRRLPVTSDDHDRLRSVAVRNIGIKFKLDIYAYVGSEMTRQYKEVQCCTPN